MEQEFSIQWHITDRCNLDCKHCYRSKPISKELETEKLLAIYGDYKAFLKKHSFKGRIAFTGGEPLMKKGMFELIKAAHKDNIRYGILTNGTLINQNVADALVMYRPEYVQISIEGLEKTNDLIRGKGTFAMIKKAIAILRENDLPVALSFTSHKLNYKEFLDVIDLGEKMGVGMVWTDRIVPLNMSPEDTKKFMMSPGELKEYYESIIKKSEELKKSGSKTNVSYHRTLFCLLDPSIDYNCIQCSSGLNHFSIMSDGDVYPCRRLPLKVGNLTESSFEDIYQNSLALKELRKGITNEYCGRCRNFNNCFGGARCVSYAYFGDYSAPDPQCWHIFKNLPSKALAYGKMKNPLL